MNTRVIEFMKAAYLKKKNGSATGGTFTAKGTPFSARRRERGKLSGEKVFMEDSPKQGNELACFVFFISFLFLFEEDANIWKARRPAEGARGQPEGTLR